MSLEVILSPESTPFAQNSISLFLGGSIENGRAKDWQNDVIAVLQNVDIKRKLQVFNPRRRAWDASWPIDDPDHIALRQQIEWELAHQDKADILVYYFAGNTISPITLFELGIYAGKNPIIYIQRAYLRFANVKITADHFGWDYYTDELEFHQAIIKRIENF